MTLHSSAALVTEVADLLAAAAESGSPVSPVRDLIGDADIGLAYAVQQELVRRRRAAGARVVGRKIGLTSPAVQQQLGVDQPDFGVLFADMDVSGVDAVPSARLLQPKVEAEIAFVLAHDLVGGDFTADSVRGAVDYAVAALEIVDSRISDWDLTIADTVADNASSGLFVLGSRRMHISDFVAKDVTMQMYADDQLVSEGTGSACLGDPLNALAWLARTAEEYGEPLQEGQIILSGALGPMAPAPPGTRIHATIAPLGEVSAAFSPRETS
ncbi:fumarylacetoacetate hydrolase family protein [Mycolicibacterium sp. 120266]|uniref:2-keto-4-pentenoate hydratase n=1 Tax=Mycolicibacterium sp. 120266 TaxID=3090601 RepID=UPI00299D4513|nr:fumarylacetoacetate hydrolase family protein [Mycolicibacterium sp. 120266]MDX1876127.1 fumarylacetoacetate hydrolase family protein [Mycolicibacterium sp. 120266]